MKNVDMEIEKEAVLGSLPVLTGERLYGFIDALLILSGYCIATWSYTQGAYLTTLVGFKQLLIGAFFGAILMLVIYQLPVILSVRWGIDIWIWLRAVLGHKGVVLMSLIIIVINYPWYAVSADLFASSMNALAKKIHLPALPHTLMSVACVVIITPLALFPHRANYISELEGFEYYGGKFYRQLGTLGTRKFIDDMALIKNIQKVIKRGDIIVIYPEARYANVGTSTIIPNSVGKLCKMLDVPVVALTMHGNYLRSPIWNTKVRKQARLKAEIQQLFTPEELKNTSILQINEQIRQSISYDEYKWQKDNKIAITYSERAEGLELVLYKCPVCGKEFQITSKGSVLTCTGCNSKWTMNEYGEMLAENGHLQFSHIPDWYEWERANVIAEIDSGKYHFEGKVHIEALPNEYNFIDLGNGTIEHTPEGFLLTFKDYGEKEEKNLFFPANTTFSLHTEYNYRNKGQCITLSTYDNTYFLFPLTEGFNATKLQFAAEYLYKINFKSKGKKL